MYNPVQEIIDEKIVKLLGLNDGDVLSYEEYYRELRELIAKNSFGEKKFSEDFLAFLVNERKRVAKNPGVFSVKTAKVSSSRDKKRNAKKLLGPSFQEKSSEVKEKSRKKIKSDPLLSLVKSIRKSVENINKILIDQTKFFQDVEEKNRKNLELESRQTEEAELEKTDKKPFENVKKILAPIEGVLDRIKRFIFFTILGRAFKVFMDWVSNPRNRKKLENIGRFLKDWWPALLGAWFFFANPLGRFIRTIIGSVAKLTFKLARFAIPKLMRFVAKNPKALAATALFTAGATVPALFPGTVDKQERKTKNAPGTDQDKLNQLKIQKQNLSFFEKMQGKGSEIDEQIYFLETGQTKRYNTGGTIFSGIVDRNTGDTVSGAGPDTQFLPIEDGGGAVLQRGEVVLQKGARERMIQKTGIDPLAYNIGSNANKPKKINSDTLASSYGGLVGLKNGGSIGIAAHHLKKDEALSSLTPGINDFTRPGSPNWPKVGKNTSIHSYIDSVGQPTIGWGSTFYDSILDGKKPVKMGDKITKGKADNILAENVSNLAKKYSNKIPYWDKMTDKQKAGLLVLGYNAPYGPIGAFKKLTKSLQRGDIKSAAQNVQRRGPNAERLALERSLLMSGPTNLRNLVGPKIVGPKIVGSGIPGIPPIFYRPSQKKEGGGRIVKENTGINIPGGTADRQLLPMAGGGSVAVHPGEGVVPRDAMQAMGEDNFNRLIAMFESGRNSNAAKLGYTKPKVSNIEPPIKKGVQRSMITLPPITSGSSGQVGSKGTPSIKDFSAVTTSSLEVRSNLSSLYGIVG